MGYHQAGFTDILGIDIVKQPRYPFRFQQGDALEFLASVRPGDFDLIHASPPCQRYCAMRRSRWQDRSHPDLIPTVRAALEKTGIPYVIENVPGAPLNAPLLLCGSMFGLGTADGAQLRRHRLFECSSLWTLCPDCNHNDGSPIGVYGGGQHPARRRPTTIGVYGHSGGQSVRDDVQQFSVSARREAMGIDWMTGAELSQAIPPAYTRWIGTQLLEMC